MRRYQLTAHDRSILYPWGERLAQLLRDLNELPDAELRAFVDAARRAEPTNCWYAAFWAAMWLSPEAEYVLRARAEGRRQSPPTARSRDERKATDGR